MQIMLEHTKKKCMSSVADLIMKSDSNNEWNCKLTQSHDTVKFHSIEVNLLFVMKRLAGALNRKILETSNDKLMHGFRYARI